MNRIVTGGVTTALVTALAVLAAPIGAHAVVASGSTVAAGHPSSTGAAGSAVHSSAQPSAQARAASAAAAFVRTSPASLKVGPHDAFRAQQVISSHGLQYVPYERTYRGLPVIGGDFVINTDSDGNVLDTSVAQTRPTHLSTVKAAVTKARARALAKAQLRRATLGSTRLVVLQRGSVSQLAWQTRVTGTQAGAPSILDVYVGARKAKVLTTKERVADGTGTAALNGPSPLSFGTTKSGSSYTMVDPNLTNTSCQDASNNTTFTDADDKWGTGSGTDKVTGCVDALFVADTEKAMLSAWDGRNGMDGSGGAWPIRIGLDDENAYYDGSQVQVGHNTAGDWIPSLDVLGHEMGHGVDDHTPGSLSGKGTQEFVADTFGASTEWYANEPAPYDTPDFTVGETINLVGSGPIRYMYDPAQDGSSADCYSSSIPNAEVHTAAGPGNHWFYLLAEGTKPTNGQPTSPTCNSTSVTGLGIQKAETIMYNAMLLKTTASSYLKYRTWTLTAAKNLDATCAQFNVVKAAWDAVSVPAQSADPTCTPSGGGTTNTVTVTNPGSQTGTVGTAKSLQIAASDSASGQTLTYSATGLPAGESISSTSGLISGTPTTAATYSTVVTAKDGTGATGTASFSWVVGASGGGGATCSGQKLGNPGFETGTASPWTTSTGVVDNSSGEAAHAGSWKAWLDGYGQTHTDTLTQSVTIPSGCKATFSFYLHIDTAETTTSTAYDKLTVKAGSTTLATYSNLNKNTGYALKSFDVSSLAGQTITVSFSGAEDSSGQTSFVIDDTALTLG